MSENNNIETHPWEPFIPENARVLIMGTFPPAPHRWKMNFYYPNPINDFWRIMGLIFKGSTHALWDKEKAQFKLSEIKELMAEQGVALNDTGYKIRRLKGNASDKFLEIVEPVHLEELLQRMPNCQAIATTGEKAAATLAQVTGTESPKMGQNVQWGDIKIWRMPSTSRAYPMKLEEKAKYYSMLFQSLH